MAGRTDQPAPIADLGASRWADREAAERRLDAGPVEAALPGLESADPEIRRRSLRSIRAKAPCVTCGGSGIEAKWSMDPDDYRGGYSPIRCTGCEGWGSKWLQRRMGKRA
jgi:hypothetical protein